MLKKNPDKRPTAEMIEAHFIFWTAKKTLEFYQVGSLKVVYCSEAVWRLSIRPTDDWYGIKVCYE